MPPPFSILGKYEEHHPMEFRRKITLHSPYQGYKTEGIKVTDWQNIPFSQPFDCHPLDPENYDQSRSHYNALGIDRNPEWTTVSREMSKHVHDEPRREHMINPHKTLVNMFTKIVPEEPMEPCYPEECANYTTTYQGHFQIPHPYIKKELEPPALPFLANRRMGYPPSKFIDDYYVPCVKLMQENKVFRHVSYNPCTGNYTNGKPGYVNKYKCVDFRKLMEKY